MAGPLFTATSKVRPSALRRWIGVTSPSSGTPVVTQLLFHVQPGNSAGASQELSTQPVIYAADADGNLVPSYGGSVTISLASGTGTLASDAGLTFAFISGVATCSALRIDDPGAAGSKTLHATDGTFAVNSNSFTVASASPSLIAHIGEGLGATGGTTSGIDTTGATLIVVNIASFASTGSLSDNKGNMYTLIKDQTGGTNKSGFFYCSNPIVGAGHTWTVASGSFCSIQVQAFDVIASTPLDQNTGAGTAGASTLSTGSITPSQANTLVVATLSHENNGGASASINGGFTISDDVLYNPGVWESGAMAYLVLSSASAQNPQWDFVNSAAAAACIASFKY